TAWHRPLRVVDRYRERAVGTVAGGVGGRAHHVGRALRETEPAGRYAHDRTTRAVVRDARRKTHVAGALPSRRAHRDVAHTTRYRPLRVVDRNREAAVGRVTDIDRRA